MRIAVVGPVAPRQFSRYLDVKPDDLPIGLVGVPVTELVHELVRLGHTVHVVTASPDIDRPKDLQADGFRLSVAPYRARARHRALDLFKVERQSMAALIADSQSDVVHAHWTYEFAWAALTSSSPTLVTAHDAPFSVLRYAPEPYRILRTALALRVRPQIRHLSAVSPYLALQWKRQMRYKSLISVVPNIAPTLAVSEDMDGKPRAPESPLTKNVTIIDIADSSPRKNVRSLLYALNILRSGEPDIEWCLKLIGTGLDSGGALAAWATANNLSGNVQFLGHCSRKEVAAALTSSTVFAHPSFEEAQPMSLLEAMQAGLPIVAGRAAGGVPWTLGEGTAGRLIDVADPAAIASGILSLVRNAGLAESLTSKADELLRSRYSAEVVASQYIELYKSAIHGADA